MHLLLLFISAALASPVVRKRYDLNHDGIPDMCHESGDGYAHCLLPDGAMTQIPSSETITASKSMSAPTTSPTSSLIPPTKSLSTSTSSAAAKDFPSNSNIFKSQKGSKWTIATKSGTATGQALGDGGVYLNGIFQGGCDKGRTSAIGGTAFVILPRCHYMSISCSPF